MDQKWIQILVILVFYHSKFNLHFFTDKSVNYSVTALKCSLVFFVFCLYVPENRWFVLMFPCFQVLEITSGAVQKTVDEGQQVEIYCKPPQMSGMVTWFRVLDKSGMEFIASFSAGHLKSTSLHQNFISTKIRDHKLILKSFNKDTDSGAYSCAVIKSNELKFGEVTRLVGGEFLYISLV